METFDIQCEADDQEASWRFSNFLLLLEGETKKEGRMVESRQEILEGA